MVITAFGYVDAIAFIEMQNFVDAIVFKFQSKIC